MRGPGLMAEGSLDEMLRICGLRSRQNGRLPTDARFDIQFESPANPEISGCPGDQLRVTMRTHSEVLTVPVGGRATATPPLLVSAARVPALSPLRHQAASCSNWLPIAALTYE